MAKGGTTLVKTHRIQDFYAVLTSAACEWFLIFLLLINGAFSYLLTKFATYCNLQTPCVLCSRIDHVISGEQQKIGWYQNLLCSDHRSEISSLVSCHIHDKVSDGHKMCDDCLMSVAPDDKTHSKSHRLLMGKLGPARGDHRPQSSFTNRDMFTSSLGSKPCSCCGKFWNSMHSSSQRSFLLNSPRIPALKPDFHLQDVYRKNKLKKICEKPSYLGRNSDSLSNYAEYSEVKLASDSESEFAHSDDDDISSQNHHKNFEAKNTLMPRFTPATPSKCRPGDSNSIKPQICSSETEPLILFPCVKPNVSDHPDVDSMFFDAVNDYGSGQIYWQHPNQKSLNSKFLPELISLNEVSPLSYADIPSQEREGSKIDSFSHDSLAAALSELVASVTNTSTGTSSKKFADDTQASDNGCSSKNHEEALEETVTSASASTQTALCENKDSAFSNRRNDDSSNVNELPITNQEREEPGFVHEHQTPTEVNGVNEQPKQSNSPNSSPRGSSSISSVVPMNHVNTPEMQTNISSCSGNQELQKATSMEPVLTGFLEGCSVSEIEGESIVDHLKRQLEHDKKCISDLYKELEEERNASAIAASHTMAMITRLQEEKAGLHMEALQYLRMTDEQAEHDGEELGKAYDLLAEKEKEIQDLEAELEFCRLNMKDEPMSSNMQKERCDLKEKNFKIQNFSVPPINIYSNSKLAELSQVTNESVVLESSLEFEEERLYISSCLCRLEKKLHQIFDNGMPNDRAENFGESEYDQPVSSNSEEPQFESKKEYGIIDQDGSIASKSDICSPHEENNDLESVGKKNSIQRKHVELVSIENEISDLNERLEALEADHDLLEHILHSLRDDNHGLQFIRDIARQLHELRKLGSRVRW